MLLAMLGVDLNCVGKFVNAPSYVRIDLNCVEKIRKCS